MVKAKQAHRSGFPGCVPAFCSCSGSAAGGRQRQHTGQDGKAAEDAKGKLGLVGLDLLSDGHLRAAIDRAGGAV